MRRTQARDAAAFLVDQNRCVGARHRRTKVLDQPARALGRVDVAREQDEAQRIGVTKERTLVGREVGAGAAEDDGSGHVILSAAKDLMAIATGVLVETP
jgi:hypothetical protein